MRKSVLLMSIWLLVFFTAMAVTAQPERSTIPRVAYYAPDNDTTIDLTGKETLVFRWSPQGIPSGGRIAYRFRVYKGFSYDVLAGQDLGPGTFSIEVPADKFEDGKLYSWHVQQRDGANMQWSLYHTWSFKVEKKAK
jgi:hypothetical protein